MKKTHLSSEMILNQKFTVEISGYNPTEVDQYLDKVLEDYNFFKTQLEDCEKTISIKANQLATQTQLIAKLKLKIDNLELQIKKFQKI